MCPPTSPKRPWFSGPPHLISGSTHFSSGASHSQSSKWKPTAPPAFPVMSVSFLPNSQCWQRLEGQQLLSPSQEPRRQRSSPESWEASVTPTPPWWSQVVSLHLSPAISLLGRQAETSRPKTCRLDWAGIKIEHAAYHPSTAAAGINFAPQIVMTCGMEDGFPAQSRF